MNIPAPQYTKEEELREVSLQFMTDAHQFAVQAEILLDDQNLEQRCQYHLGYLSKISVMLHMSIECSLKACVCLSHIGEDPKDVYFKRIRQAGHSVHKLRLEIPAISTILTDPNLAQEIDRLTASEVSERYCVELSAVTDLLVDFNIDPVELAKKIGECRKLLSTALELRKTIWDHRQEAFKGHRTLHPSAVKAILQRITTR